MTELDELKELLKITVRKIKSKNAIKLLAERDNDALIDELKELNTDLDRRVTKPKLKVGEMYVYKNFSPLQSHENSKDGHPTFFIVRSRVYWGKDYYATNDPDGGWLVKTKTQLTTDGIELAANLRRVTEEDFLAIYTFVNESYPKEVCYLEDEACAMYRMFKKRNGCKLNLIFDRLLYCGDIKNNDDDLSKEFGFQRKARNRNRDVNYKLAEPDTKHPCA